MGHCADMDAGNHVPARRNTMLHLFHTPVPAIEHLQWDAEHPQALTSMDTLDVGRRARAARPNPAARQPGLTIELCRLRMDALLELRGGGHHAPVAIASAAAGDHAPATIGFNPLPGCRHNRLIMRVNRAVVATA